MTDRRRIDGWRSDRSAAGRWRIGGSRAGGSRADGSLVDPRSGGRLHVSDELSIDGPRTDLSPTNPPRTDHVAADRSPGEEPGIDGTDADGAPAGSSTEEASNDHTVTGDTVTGDTVTGDTVTGDTVTGDTVTGNAGDSNSADTPAEGRPGGRAATGAAAAGDGGAGDASADGASDPAPPDRPRDPLDRVLDRHDAARAKHTTGRMARRGAKALGAANMASQLTRVVATIVLANLLGPEVFGVVALVTVVTGFFERILGDTGTSAAVVQHRELTQRLASSVFWFNVSLGGITTVAFVLLGGPVASLLGEPSAAPYVRALGCTALINALSYVQQSMLRRHGRFGPLAVGRYANVAINSGLAIFLAVLGWEVWALVVGTLAGAVAWVAILWGASAWRPSYHIAREDLRRIRHLSANITAFNFFGYFVQAGDRLIIGRFLGTVPLGYYGMANRLLRYPVQGGLQPYREVVLPMLSRLQDDPKTMGRVYIRTVSALAFVLFPVTVGVAVMADPLVRTVLGSKWEPAIPIISIIALVATFQAVTTTTGSLYVVMERADLWLRWGILSAVVTLASYSIGLRWGVEGVAWGYLIAIVALTYPSFLIPFRLIGLRVRDLGRAIGPTALAAAAMGGAAYGAAQIATSTGADAGLELAAGVVTGFVVYAGWAVLTRPQAFRDLLSLTKRDRGAFLP